jgi:hypothetical protein
MKNIYKLALAIIGCVLFLQACKKDDNSNNKGSGGDGGNTDTTTTIILPTEPAIANTQGFFLDNWQAKTWVAPSSTDVTKPGNGGAITINVDLSKEITKVSNYIYGNNTNPFMGQIATDATLMGNITTLSPNILRFPGGSLSISGISHRKHLPMPRHNYWITVVTPPQQDIGMAMRTKTGP